jgi:hypothetical protein
MALFPLSLAMVELGVTFLRRLYNRKSPFRGDKFHLHHILKNYHQYSASRASTFLALGYSAIMALGFSITHYFGPLLGLIGQVSLFISAYLFIGRHHWKGEDTLVLTPASLFDYLLKKDISVINSQHVDQFEIQLIKTDEVDQSSQEDKSSKKAA